MVVSWDAEDGLRPEPPRPSERFRRVRPRPAAPGEPRSSRRCRSAAQLNLRLAELTDLVTELLLPVAQRDEDEVDELDEYSQGL